MSLTGVRFCSGGCIGDEGKANVYTALQKDGDVLVRVQGGTNAGNSVVTKNGEKIVYHSLPPYTDIIERNILGIVVFGTEYILGIKCISKEVEKVRSLGYKGTILISDNVTPVLSEDIVQDQKNKSIGSTANGVGPAKIRRFMRDEFSCATLRQILNCLECGNKTCCKMCDEDYHTYMYHITKLYKMGVRIVDQLEINRFLKDKQVFVMGAHGYGLSLDSPRYPYCTTSDINPVSAFIKHCPLTRYSVTACVKLPYMTRVGKGTITPYNEPEQCERAIFACFILKGGEFGATTGRMRKTCWLNLAEIKKHCELYGVTDVALTKCDLWGSVSKEIESDFDNLRKHPEILDFVGCSAKGLDELRRRYNNKELNCVFITGYTIDDRLTDYPYPQYLEQDGLCDFYYKDTVTSVKKFNYNVITKRFPWPRTDEEIDKIIKWVETYLEVHISVSTHGPTINDIKYRL